MFTWKIQSRLVPSSHCYPSLSILLNRFLGALGFLGQRRPFGLVQVPQKSDSSNECALDRSHSPSLLGTFKDKQNGTHPFNVFYWSNQAPIPKIYQGFSERRLLLSGRWLMNNGRTDGRQGRSKDGEKRHLIDTRQCN